MVNATANIATLIQQAKPEVVTAIRAASDKTGVDFAYLLQNAATESSFNPTAGNTGSSARGLYQFIDSTWLETVDRHGAEHGLGAAADAITRDSNGKPVVTNPAIRRQILALRDNPEVASLMAAEFTKDNQATLENTLGRSVGNTELYMAHFLGASGAGKFLSKLDAAPQARADTLLPHAAQANQAVFYKGGRALSVDQIYDRFADRFADSDPALAVANSIADAAIIAAPVPELAAISTAIAPVAMDSHVVFAMPVGLPQSYLSVSNFSHDNSSYNNTPLSNLPEFALEILQSLSLPGALTAVSTRGWKV
ncbi:MAG: transglycosylase SLT domain-containing protein [Pseudomonadota bacterium]